MKIFKNIVDKLFFVVYVGLLFGVVAFLTVNLRNELLQTLPFDDSYLLFGPLILLFILIILKLAIKGTLEKTGDIPVPSKRSVSLTIGLFILTIVIYGFYFLGAMLCGFSGDKFACIIPFVSILVGFILSIWMTIRVTRPALTNRRSDLNLLFYILANATPIIVFVVWVILSPRLHF